MQGRKKHFEKIFQKSLREVAETPPRVTGIIGCGRGVGVTHLAVLCANYLAGARRKRTALLELGPGGDLERLGDFCGADASGHGDDSAAGHAAFADVRADAASFRLCGVTYFCAATAATLASCMNGPFDEIVVDLGGDFERGKTDFLRCGKKMLVGSLSEWRQEEFLRVISGNRRACREDWQLLVTFGSAESEREIERQFRLELLRVPFWPDAFRITGEMFGFFEILLNQRGRQ